MVIMSNPKFKIRKLLSLFPRFISKTPIAKTIPLAIIAANSPKKKRIFNKNIISSKPKSLKLVLLFFL